MYSGRSNGIYGDYDYWILNLADEWLQEIRQENRYFNLVRQLHSIEFKYIINADYNRYCDGIDFRLVFAENSSDYTYRDIYLYLQDSPCSVLEMMMGLAYRCENEIMVDSDVGEEPNKWFYAMIENMGLDEFNDNEYDPDDVLDIVNKMMYREYAPDGSGGLFRIKNSSVDIRKAEIWYQMCWYLNEEK